MEYNFKEIENNWQAYWAKNKTFAAKDGGDKPKYYVLDMFPYPSGAGLHVGHPLGYIASDIVARYKRHKGFNVLHPMGYDSFGLPAEQYAIQTGQHPKITTENNIAVYRRQLDKIGFSFDWDREVRTSDPAYYKWTQWIFIQIFNSWYNKATDKAEPISSLISEFELNGNKKVNACCDEDEKSFSAAEWQAFSEKEQSDILMAYRIAYLGEAFVNWCPALGTVLANDEIKDGVSERGGHPVERKLMKQWSMRISAYAQRLLDGLDTLDWTDSLKEAQRNWIGKSEGTSLKFTIQGSNKTIEVFTTRPDTVFGVSFVTLAPEHDLVGSLTTLENKAAVEAYVTQAKNRSERERQADINKITGVFTGSYVEHPFTGKLIPIWIGDYVLAGYGTGAVMAVPAHDSRDYSFAKHFGLPILEVVKGTTDVTQSGVEGSYDAKEGILINSDFLNGLQVKDAMKLAIQEIEIKQLGKGKVNFRLRDAVFGRQRYWGEPIPVYYKNDIPYALPENELPLVLPEVDKYLPTEDGEPPLARAASSWKYKGEFDYEHSTMPGWAGSSWYFLRYMDPKNSEGFVSKQLAGYWKQVDLYIGGSEHATGHLLYVRFWTKFLKDLGYIDIEEPAKKLINQGMIQGRSNFVYRVNGENKLVSAGLKNNYEVSALHVDVSFVNNDVLDIEAFKKWRDDFKNAEFILEDGKYICGAEVEKMSKSKYNVVTPDDIGEKFGSDTLRLYEMFLGPLEQSKPWNTNGITGVHGFLKKLWRLFYSSLQGGAQGAGDVAFNVSNDEPTKGELKALHKTIKKITEDIERFSFNTSISNFMICVNELTEAKCNKKAILEPLLICLSPYAPHIAEELWKQLGHTESISTAPFPDFNEAYLVDDSINYPVSVNGKLKFTLELPATLTVQEVEAEVMNNEQTQKLLEGKQPKKVIVVHKKIVNMVV
ncbi:MAG: leucyl-tRNA synthetase [Bacteroidetes bacterium]|jgi:leucyl-tRNA synthetase|nr:leucyl-tRNA synthetase [Bacteroidota bacterium]MDF2450905.1 leucyl-tRNA synthetase [Bacteroidota bacterium]